MTFVNNVTDRRDIYTMRSFLFLAKGD